MKLYKLAWLVVAVMAMPLAIDRAAARPPVTKYVHYSVAGPTAQNLYSSMLRNGPHVGGNRAYASISMVPSISAYVQQGASSCSIHKFAIDVTFTIRLPELKRGAKLSTDVRKSFAAFYAFAKRHEETHRSIWLKCAAEAEAVVNAISARNCSEANRRALAAIEKMNACRASRDLAFDNAEQLRLVRHPFIKQVLASTKSGSAALLAPTPRKKKKG
jgi:predicted secreted Zn-dependent protease